MFTKVKVKKFHYQGDDNHRNKYLKFYNFNRCDCDADITHRFTNTFNILNIKKPRDLELEREM
jgi:hypothetical protein